MHILNFISYVIIKKQNSMDREGRFMAISFIHTGDIHLEKTFHFKNQQRDFGKEHRIDLWLTFDQIINTAEVIQIIACIIMLIYFNIECFGYADCLLLNNR